MIKTLRRILGGLLTGFGLGILLTQSYSLSRGQLLVILVFSLILGGFFLAPDWRKKRGQKKKKDESLSSVVASSEEKSQDRFSEE